MSSIYQSQTAYNEGHLTNTSASSKDGGPDLPHPQTTVTNSDLTAPSTELSAGSSARPSTIPP
ncbi:hypothetical protein A2U01_0110222, partial [Trifolium medium]|nr:hypothetical protein [Trifolium medium]